MHHRLLGSYLATAIVTLSLSSEAALANELEWRGFLTTGVAFSDSKVPYLQGINRKARVTEETFLGLNLSKKINDEWRVAAQILGRSGQADGAAKVDWAFVTYEPNDDYDIVLGKQKIPIWMISEYIDIGRAYPWVVPPEEVYSLFGLKSFTGGAAAYNLNFGESKLTIQPYGGDVVLEAAPSAPGVDTKIRGSNMFGLSVEWALGDTLVRAAINQAQWDLNLGPNVEYGARNYQIVAAGFRTELAGFSLMAEYAATDDKDESRYLDEADRLTVEAQSVSAEEAAALLGRSALLRTRIGGSEGYYATLGKELSESFLLHGTYAAVKRPSIPGLSQDQSSAALGLNYDINTDAVVKIEAKRVMVPDDSRGLFDAKPLEDEAMIYRLGYSMIF